MGLQVRNRLAVFSVGLALVVLAGCGSGATPQATPESANSGGTNAGGKLLIGLSMESVSERFERDQNMFVAKAKELGADVIVQNANGNDATQLSQAENMLSKGVKVLVVLAHDGEAAAAIVEKAHERKVPVIAYDRLIKNSDVDLYISFDNIKVGELQATAILKKVPKGNFAYIGGAPTDNNAYMFKEGAMKVLQPLVSKGDIKLVYDQFTNDWKPENALSNMENALTANKNNIQAVVAANDGTAGAVVQALTAQGLAGKVAVSGQDADTAGLQRIVEGTQTMTVYKPLKKLAETAADLAVKMGKGEDVKSAAKLKVNNGKAEVPFVALEPIAVDYGNIVETVVNDGFVKLEEICKTAPDKCPKK